MIVRRSEDKEHLRDTKKLSGYLRKRDTSLDDPSYDKAKARKIQKAPQERA
jgi:hypothetical protein